MLVIELEQETLPLSEQVIIQRLLVSHLLDDPSKVHLLPEPLLSIILNFLGMSVLTLQAERKET